MRLPASDIGINVLLGLCWLGEMSTSQIRRIWFPTYHHDSVTKILRLLRTDGMVRLRLWSTTRSGRTPLRQDGLWSLTKAGQDFLSNSVDFAHPRRYMPPRARRTVAHDIATSELIVRMIELARPAGLSGIYVEREARIDPPQLRPIMDAFVSLRTGDDYPETTLVPWSSEQPSSRERRRRYAVENDRNSEAPGIIEAKALAYQKARTARWVRENGTFPIPLWLTPTERRLRLVLDRWRQVWPDGKYILTTDDWLSADRWLVYNNGRLWERTLFARQSDDETPEEHAP